MGGDFSSPYMQSLFLSFRVLKSVLIGDKIGTRPPQTWTPIVVYIRRLAEQKKAEKLRRFTLTPSTQSHTLSLKLQFFFSCYYNGQQKMKESN